MKTHRLHVEGLESRVMLAADVLGELVVALPQDAIVGDFQEIKACVATPASTTEAQAAGLETQPHGQAVSRPLKGAGDSILVVTPVADNIGVWHFEEIGQLTHGGRFGNEADGTMDLLTGTFLSGAGTVTVANGDTVDWELTDDPTVAVITGGTGRF